MTGEFNCMGASFGLLSFSLKQQQKASSPGAVQLDLLVSMSGVGGPSLTPANCRSRTFGRHIFFLGGRCPWLLVTAHLCSRGAETPCGEAGWRTLTRLAWYWNAGLAARRYCVLQGVPYPGPHLQGLPLVGLGRSWHSRLNQNQGGWLQESTTVIAKPHSSPSTAVPFELRRDLAIYLVFAP